MDEITDEMVNRAAAVIFEPPGLQYFMAPHPDAVAAVAHNREVIRRALAAALQSAEPCSWCGKPAAAPSDEDRIRDAMTEATDHPGRIVITCTQHGAVNCPCLSAPAGGSAPTAAHPPGRVITR